MNRRGFFGSLAAWGVALFVSTPAPAQAETPAPVVRKTVPIGSDPNCQCKHCRIYRQYYAAMRDWKPEPFDWYMDPQKAPDA